MRKIFTIWFFILCLSSNGSNMLLNGGFENGLTQWQNLTGGSGSAVFSLETSDVQSGTGALRIQVTQAGGNPWDVQSIHSGWASSAGIQYTLTFYAKVIGSTSSIRVVQQIGNSYAARDFAITNSWQQYSWTFTAGANNLQLKIHYFQAGTFLLDNFEILDPAGPPGPKSIVVDAGKTYQEMIGFGGALTWHCDRITRSAKKNEMAKLLFDDLGADIIRLKNWYYPLNYPTNKSPQNLEVSWFRPHFVATDELAKLAKQYNPDVDILLSSWGPPSALKSNNALNGGTLKKNSNGEFMYDEFAQYWVDILDNIGFKPDYISIQNEPGYENTGWTTTAWRPEESASFPSYAKASDFVFERLYDRGDMPKMIGPETENIGNAVWDNRVNTYRSMVSTVKDKDYLAAYAYHIYNFGSSSNIDVSLLNMVRDEFGNKPNMMTEYSSGNYDWLQTADLIQLNLIEANTSAYIYWEMMWDQDSGTAMIAVDNNLNYVITPYYYSIKHFSKYVNKGDVRIDISGNTSTLKTTGFLNPDKTRLTLVVSNLGLGSETLDFNMGSLQVKFSNAYQSTDGNYFSDLGNVDLSKAFEIPARSLTTLVLELDPVLSSNLLKSVSSLEIYPVPAQDMIHVKGDITNEKWDMINMRGLIIKSGLGKDINIQDLKPAMYFLRIDDHILKFIKKN